MKNKVKSFLSRATNVVGIAIFIISVLLIVSGCFLKGNAQNILISFGTNLITSVILFFLIDKRIDVEKQRDDEKVGRKNERKQILKQHLSIEVQLKELFIHYNQLVVPHQQRILGNKVLPVKEDGFVQLDHISQMVDVCGRSFSCFSPYKESALAAFKRTHDEIMGAFKIFLCEVDFEYYDGVKESLEKIVAITALPNCIETMETRTHDNRIIDAMQKWMKSYDGNVREDVLTSKYSGTICYQPIMLYYYLSELASSVNAYMTEINKIK